MGDDGESCSTRNQLDDAIEQLKDFIADAEKSMDIVRNVHEAIAVIHTDTKHLATMPILVDEIKELRRSLLAAATDRWRVPLPVFLITMIAVCVVLLVRELGPRDLDLSPSGLRIKSSRQKEPDPKPNKEEENIWP